MAAVTPHIFISVSMYLARLARRTRGEKAVWALAGGTCFGAFSGRCLWAGFRYGSIAASRHGLFGNFALEGFVERRILVQTKEYKLLFRSGALRVALSSLQILWVLYRSWQN